MSSENRPIASYWHLVGLLILLGAFSAGFYHLQTAQSAPNSGPESQSSNVPVYVAITLGEWALVFYIWLGLRKSGVPFRDLIGGRWGNFKAVLVDIGLAAGLWIVLSAVELGLAWVLPEHRDESTFKFLQARGPIELTLWVLMSITAGFCEEAVFRGYLQRQFLAITGSGIAAVVIQGVIFGVGHAYGGKVPIVAISVLGILLGLFAYWRKSLRPGMIFHAWADASAIIFR